MPATRRRSERNLPTPPAQATSTSPKRIRNRYHSPSTPRFRPALSAIILIRICSAAYNIILDCDETFNYWEPLHYLRHNYGFQTWEYSPVYALRSYAYLLVHGILGELGSALMFGHEKLGFFYGLRIALAALCALSEVCFYRAIVYHFRHQVGRSLLIFLLLSPGLFHASTAFLPSSSTMICVMFVYSAWLFENYFWGVFVAVVAVLSGWPYVGVMFIPFALDTFFKCGFFRPLFYGIFSGSLVLGFELVVNHHYYGKWVFPAFNIVNYNVLGGAGEGVSSELYGTEPFSYYFKNGFLNFNLVFILSLFAFIEPVRALVFGNMRQPTSMRLHPFRVLLYLSPLYIWLGIMLSSPHKEERFLQPIYPLICLAAAYSWTIITEWLKVLILKITRGEGSIGPNARKVLRGLSTLFYFTFGLLAVSRIVGMRVNYGAPMDLYRFIHNYDLPSQSTICLEKEWYRFPAHFFIPTEDTNIRFIRSGYRGQLPASFAKENGTARIPPNMNNLNQDEPSRYIPLAECDFVVDLVLENQDSDWTNDDQWEQIVEYPFLDASKTKVWARAFYIPYLSERYSHFAPYSLFKRRKNL